MNPLFHTGISISDSLKTVRKSVLIYETIIYNEFELTPTIDSMLINSINDSFLKTLLNEYLNIAKENFNARISFLYCIYKYIETHNVSRIIPIHYSKTINYLAHYSKLNIPYNHKELIIAELIIISLLKSTKI